MLQVIPLFICALSALVAVQAQDDCSIAVQIGNDTYSLPCETDGVIDLNQVFPLCATGGDYNGTADGGNTSEGGNTSGSGAVISEMAAGVGAGGIGASGDHSGGIGSSGSAPGGLGASGGRPGGLGASGGRPGGIGANARLGSGGPAVNADLGAGGAGIGAGLGPFSAGLGPSGLGVGVATPTP
ncbi:hypothetical protein Unana1_07671 [Umbelopsis nana]